MANAEKRIKSTVIATTSELPTYYNKDWKNYSKLLLTKDAQGRARHFLENKKTNGLEPISAEVVIAGHGHDPTTKPENVEAVWHQEGHDLPVVISGIYGKFGDEILMRATGSKAGIPRSQLEYLNHEDFVPKSDSGAAKIAELEQELDQRDTRIIELESQNNDLNVSTIRKDAEIAEGKEAARALAIQVDELTVSNQEKAAEIERLKNENKTSEKNNGSDGIARLLGGLALAGVIALGIGGYAYHEHEEKEANQTIAAQKYNDDNHYDNQDKQDTQRDNADLKRDSKMNQRLGALQKRINALEAEEKAEEAGEKNAAGKEHNEQGSSIFIEPGHGYTQEIQDLFPGHSAQEYLAAHLAAINKYGENYVTGVPKYTTSAGDIRFGRPGRAMIRPSVRHFLQQHLQNS